MGQDHNNNNVPKRDRSSNLFSSRHLQVDAFVIINPTARREIPSLISLLEIADSQPTTFRSHSRRKLCGSQRSTQLWSTTDQEDIATMITQKNASTATLELDNTRNGVSSLLNGNSVQDNNNHRLYTEGSSFSTFPPDGLPLPDIPLPTANGGYSHTTASRAKISAANKGKTPWNKGRARSEEEKARIAAGVRARIREEFLKKLDAMGLTEEEYEQQKKEERRKREAERRARRTPNGGVSPSAETRAKISKALKEKHASGQIKKRAVDPSKVRRGFQHTEETRRKISESLKKRWRNDEEYREGMIKAQIKSSSKEETRKKISDTLKRRWQDPNFREGMVQAINSRKTSDSVYDKTYREKISEAMKRKWQDPEYRSKTLTSIKKAAQSRTATNPPMRKVKGAASAKMKNVQLSPVAPLSAQDLAKRKQKKTKKIKEKSTRTIDKNAFAAVEPLKAPRKPIIQRIKGDSEPASPPTLNGESLESAGVEERPKKIKKKTKKNKTKEDDKDGSVTRLREERRDLFDLLYGDEDDLLVGNDDEMATEVAKPSTISKMGLIFGDEDLDSFDPYGLDDY
jgi:hypothetical protein